MPMDSSQSAPLNDKRHESDVVPIVQKELPTAEEGRSGEPALNPDAGRNSSDQHIGMAPEGSDFSPGLRGVEPSIHVSPRPSGLNDQLTDRPSIGRRTFRSVARFFIMALAAALIGVAASSAWQSYGNEANSMVRTWASSLDGLSSAWQSRGDEAKRMVKTWASSLDWLLSAPITKSSRDVDIAAKQTGSTPAGQVSVQKAALRQSALVTQTAPAPAAAATSELVQQVNAIARDLAVVRHSVEQLAAKQEQMAHTVATLQAVDQDVSQKMSSPPLSVPIPPRKNVPRVTPPQPPAGVSILADWWIRDSREGYVYVQGHGDVYEAVLGAPLPGLGPVEQIKRQDGRWVVVTPRGIIVSRSDRRYFEQH